MYPNPLFQIFCFLSVLSYQSYVVKMSIDCLQQTNLMKDYYISDTENFFHLFLFSFMTISAPLMDQSSLTLKSPISMSFEMTYDTEQDRTEFGLRPVSAFISHSEW